VTADRTARRRRSWQAITIAILVAGYSGYYLCRSNLPVALPLILQDMASRGVPTDLARIRFGTIASIGVLAYAAGKFGAGFFADRAGGRLSFLGGMLGSVICTGLFAAAGSFPFFTAAWVANRSVQAFGWAGVVKIGSRWFSPKSYGTIMAVLSLSFLFGDAAARTFMSLLIGGGLGWRGVFLVAGGVVLGIFVIGVLFLHDSPEEVGVPEPRTAVETASAEPGATERLFKNTAFWIVCVLSVGLTLIRETFNLWTVTYFHEVAGMSTAEAAAKSALLPLFGGLSVLLAGYASDRLGRGARAAITFGALLAAGPLLVVLGSTNFVHGSQMPVLLTVAVSFLLIGPYSYLAGAIAMDFGGTRASATASGVIDGTGYLGGVLAGDAMARISVLYGWTGAFLTLAGVCAGLAVVAAWFWREQGGLQWSRAFRSTPTA
jgi:OPA family glycerol-3-phosphate transporter-like MFS transporter